MMTSARAPAGRGNLKRKALAGALASALALPLAAIADTGVGVDLWQGNKLDPAAGGASRMVDARGTSWLGPGEHRTPTGNLIMCPAQPPRVTEAGDWRYYGILQLGWLGTSGDDDNALWNRYADWDSGLVLGLLAVHAERPGDGSYVDARASRISETDQYYTLRAGRAGKFRVDAFARDLPNVLGNSARPIWNGVGSNHLTLAGGLTPGASTPAAVAAVSAATPERRLQVNRSKQGLGVNYFFDRRWTGYLDVSDEQRKGERPFGGTFYFNYTGVDNGGVLETVKPIDDSTINVNAGLRYAGPVWRMEFGYSGSWYRDRHTAFDYENPFALTPVIPGAQAPALGQGQFAMEPDNDYHNLRASFTRRVAWNGELSITVSGARMRQNDTLLPPVNCQGSFGIDLSPTGAASSPMLYPCSDWNTPAALSRQSADMGIDTTMLDARLVLQPGHGVTLRGGVKFHREDYRNTYLAFNPLTGDYGYVAENGARGSVLPGGAGFWSPENPSVITRIRSLPLDTRTIDANLGADWRLSPHDTLGATLTATRDEPTHRERSRVEDRSLALHWTNRALDWLTLRANYTRLHQSGDRYDSNPYDFTYSISLPGFVPPPGGIPAHTVDALRKYDLASRDENKADLIATLMPREDMTVSATLRGDWNDYDAVLGRQRMDNLGATLAWDWQPAPATSASVFLAWDRSRLRLANVNEINDSGSDPALGGSTFPDIGRWTAEDQERDRSLGATFNHRVGRVTLDAGWTLLDARGSLDYGFASPAALAYFQDATGVAGNAFPALRYRVDSLTIGVTIAIAERVSLRLFDYHERGRISDWHYLGFDQGLVHDHRVYTDAGPESYDANLVGLLLDLTL
jgi:hypothetical protein